MAMPKKPNSSFRVLLVYPPTIHQIRMILPDVLLRDNHSIIPPLSISYLAASLRRIPGIDVQVLDAQRVTRKEDLEQALKAHPADLVGVSAMTMTLYDALKVLRLARKYSPEAATCIGGFHLLHYPLETLSHDCVDYGVMGDGEQTLCSLATCLANREDPSAIPGLATKENSRQTMPQPAWVEDLDKLPFPEFPPLLSGNYHSYVDARQAAPILTSRGCPFSCTYCCSHPERFRRRSIPNVLEEIKLRKKQGYHSLAFWDESLNVPEKRLNSLCSQMIKQNLVIDYAARLRPDHLTSETISLLKQSGCTRLAFGVDITPESVSQRYNRKIDLDKTTKAFKQVRNEGMTASANFILGIEDETKNDLMKRLKEIREFPVDYFQFTLMMLFPGTKLYQNYKEKHLKDPYRQFTLKPEKNLTVLHTDSPLSLHTRIKLIKKAYFYFYFHPARFLGLVKQRWKKGQAAEGGIRAALSILLFAFRPWRAKNLPDA